MSVRSLLATGTIIGAALGGVSPAFATTSQATQDAIKAQQAQIDYLKQQLEQVSDKLQQLQVKQAAEVKAVETKVPVPQDHAKRHEQVRDRERRRAIFDRRDRRPSGRCRLLSGL